MTNITPTNEDILKVQLSTREHQIRDLMLNPRGPVIVFVPNYAELNAETGASVIDLFIIDDGHMGNEIPPEMVPDVLCGLLDQFRQTAEHINAPEKIRELSNAILSYRATSGGEA